MKRFLIKNNIKFEYSFLIHRKILKLNKKKWLLYKKIQFRNYLEYLMCFYRYDTVKIKKKISFLKKNFTLRLNNKQLVKYFYGGIKNKLLLFYISNKTLFSSTLESRLDIVLFRSNLFDSVFTARQLINHNKILVNDRLIKKQSYKLCAGDVIQTQSNKNLNFYNNHFIPTHLEVSYKLRSIIFLEILKVNVKDFLLFTLKCITFYKVFTNYVIHRKK